MRLAYDDSLGLPAALIRSPAIEVLSFHDVGALLDSFTTGAVEACFAPAGVLASLGSVPHAVVAQAVVEGMTSMRSRLVVRSEEPCEGVEDAVGLPMGYVNTCAGLQPTACCLQLTVSYTTSMSKRMQVVIDDAELARFEETARSLGFTLSEWVRQVLRAAASTVSRSDVDAKRAAIERAARHAFPAPDIDEMLAEIERGYADEATA